MPHRTAPPPAAEEQILPVDIVTMRETVSRLLDTDAMPETLPPADDELADLIATVRGHIEVLAPEVEAAGRNLTPGSTRRYTTLGCVWEARSRLEGQPSPRFGGAPGYARRLARTLNALCDHYEALSGTER
ncbi:DUF6415 family natural product biosynthesis protein [Streptomyces sp. NPDC001273]|uniref:DUF6415 family natural product biosynthesis protein n=1 Tax=unclassified Streptomyces TaxID=2593676 RepID=UPI0033CE41EC